MRHKDGRPGVCGGKEEGSDINSSIRLAVLEKTRVSAGCVWVCVLYAAMMGRGCTWAALQTSEHEVQKSWPLSLSGGMGDGPHSRGAWATCIVLAGRTKTNSSSRAEQFQRFRPAAAAGTEKNSWLRVAGGVWLLSLQALQSLSCRGALPRV